MRLENNSRIGKLLLGFLLCGVSISSYGEKLDENMKEQNAAVTENQQSQKKVDSFAQQTETLMDEYRNVLSSTENLRIYNKQLKILIESQNKEKASLNDQIANIEGTSRGVVPLMISMIDTLEQFVSLDVPFLPEERANRIENLKTMMNRADVTTSEKYRRVLEAYQVENEFGRTIEAYSGNLELDGKSFAVTFLRVGRISLMYQSIDGKQSGVWDQEGKSWKALEASYNKPINQGIQIAKKQAAPDLMELPIKAAEVL